MPPAILTVSLPVQTQAHTAHHQFHVGKAAKENKRKQSQKSLNILEFSKAKFIILINIILKGKPKQPTTPQLKYGINAGKGQSGFSG